MDSQQRRDQYDEGSGQRPSGHSDPRAAEALEANLKAARRFYDYDRKLTTQDRSRLGNIFWVQWVVIPVTVLPFVYAGIRLPVLLAKRTGAKTGRGGSVILGFLGAIMGGRLTDSLYYQYQKSALSDAPNAQAAFMALSTYPAQLGATYYNRTAKEPSTAMPDPATIDWKTTPRFPINLTLQRRGPPRQIPTTFPPTQKPGAPIPGTFHRGPLQAPAPAPPVFTQVSGSDSDNVDSFDVPESNDFADESQPDLPPNLRKSSAWDRIRSGQRPKPDGRRQSEDIPSGYSDPPVPSTWQPQSFDRRGGSESQAAFDARIEQERLDTESQAEFDARVEQERLGQGVADDFSESEKKWT